MSLRSKIQDMMLRERSRAVTRKKEVLPTDAASPSPPIPASSTSPSLLVGSSAKNSKESEAAMSSRSMLETKPFTNHWESHLVTTGNYESRHRPWQNGSSRAIGLGLVGALSNDGCCDTRSKMVVFGSQLKIQTLPTEFSSKIKNSETSKMESGHLISNANATPQLFMDIELLEDYTCVIFRGPNPKKTHIFNNCIIESCDDGFITTRKESSSDDQPGYAAETPLSFHTSCKEELGKGKNISICRGEKELFCHEHHQQRDAV
ncbi:protein MARD1-like [Canna indica]|uniref:Protein MARD1-like n=1 Tax=Canna indica TaxID=4628 RepID=A0AAQ3JV82_9LILI|nr:protein MARD1-like [Canna indica]